MKINESKTLASIQIEGAHSAEQLDSLIADLAALRSEMAPAVPLTLEEFRNGTGGNPNVSKETDPFMSAKALKNGGVRIWLRNSGTGWAAFDLSIEKACVLRDFLIVHTPEGNPGPSLFDDDLSGGGVTH